MNKSQKWSFLSIGLLWITLGFQFLSSHFGPSNAAATPSASTVARDKSILANLQSATAAQVFRSHAPHSELIKISAAQRQRFVSQLRFTPCNCPPADSPIKTGTKGDSLCFHLEFPQGSALIVLELDGEADFYGDTPKRGPRTLAYLCPQSGRDLRNLLMQDANFKALFSAK